MKHLGVFTSSIIVIVQKNCLVFGSKDNFAWCSGQLHLQIKRRGKFWKSNVFRMENNRDLACFPYSEISLLGSHHVYPCFRVETRGQNFVPSGKKTGRDIAFGCGIWTEVSLHNCGQMSGNRKPASLFFFQITQLCILSPVRPFSSLMLKVLT